MIEKIEAKITAQVNSILKKDFIDFYDYQILIGEINRLKEKEKTEKWEEEKEQRNEAMKAALSNMFS